MTETIEGSVIQVPATVQRRPSVPDVLPADQNPMAMLARAVAQGWEPDRLKQLMDLQERFEANEARKAFAAAKAAFMENPPVVTKDKENKQYESRYSSIGNLVNTVNAALSKHGLTPSWKVEQGDRITVTCVLSHRLGHSESVSMSGLPDDSGKKNPLQQIKSTVTYLKIATYEAVTGIASSEGNADDDGNGAGEREETGLSEDAYANHLAAIESAADDVSITTAWDAAAKACHAAQDPKAHAALKGVTIARKASLKAKT